MTNLRQRILTIIGFSYNIKRD